MISLPLDRLIISETFRYMLPYIIIVAKKYT